MGLTFAVLFLAVRARGASVAWAAAVSLALAVGSEARFTPRPEALGRLLMALLCLVLVRDLTRRSWRELALVPVLLALWANVHAGVVFGLVLVGCHLLGVLLPSILRLQGAARRRLLLGCTGAGLVCLAALLLNPGGADLLRYALFHVTKVDAVVKLGEFETPGLAQRPLFWMVLGALPMLLWMCRREARLSEWLGWLVFGALACRAIRLIPEFFLVVGPSLGWAAGKSLARWQAWAGRPGRWVRVAAPALLPVLALATVPYPTLHLVRRVGLGLDPFRNPQRAIARARLWGLSGRVFAGWDVSGMVEWSLPDAPVQVDPRLLAYPESVFHAVEQAEESQQAFDAYVDHWGVEWALRSQQRLRFTGAGLFDARRWAVVFWDEGGQILVRRDVPRFADLVRAEEFVEFLPATPVFESWRSLRGARRARWLAEATRLADASPLLVDAHAALCLEHARGGELSRAGQECQVAAVAADARYWLHPTPGGLRSVNAALAHVVLAGELARRPGSEDPGPLLTRATALAPGSPDVWTGVGAVELERKRPSQAAAAFRRALSVEPAHRRAAEGLGRAEALIGSVK